jgi:hypothetical protein
MLEWPWLYTWGGEAPMMPSTVACVLLLPMARWFRLPAIVVVLLVILSVTSRWPFDLVMGRMADATAISLLLLVGYVRTGYRPLTIGVYVGVALAWAFPVSPMMGRGAMAWPTMVALLALVAIHAPPPGRS